MVLGRTFEIVPLSESGKADNLAEQPVSAAVVDGTPYRTFSQEVLRTLRSRPEGDAIAILEIVDPDVLNSLAIDSPTRSDPQANPDAQANHMVTSDSSTAAMLAGFWQACAKRDERSWAFEHEAVSAAAYQAKKAFSVL